MSSIYKKYCNDIQNPALGAYAIASFVNEYKKEAEENKLPNLIHLFLFISMVMNKDIRNSIKKDNFKGKSGILSIDRFLSEEIYKNHNSFGTLHNNIKNYREYTLTSLIFAIRIGIISLTNNGEIDIVNLFKKYKQENYIISASEKMGKLFAKDPYSLNKIIIGTGVAL